MTDAKAHTAGPWMPGHFVDDGISCNCTSILSGGYAGSICTISIDNGLPISEGGNGAPPLEEAKANALLIAAAPDMLAALLAAMECGMVPLSSAKERGASRYSQQVIVADQIRAAISLATTPHQSERTEV